MAAGSYSVSSYTRPSAQVRRPFTSSTDYSSSVGYGRRGSTQSARSASVPPGTVSSVSRTRAATPGPSLPGYGYSSAAVRYPSSASSVSDVRRSSLSTVTPFTSLSGGRSLNVSVTPLRRPAYRAEPLIDDDDDFMTSSITRRSAATTRSRLPPAKHTARLKAQTYLDDIKEDDETTRSWLSDMKMRAAKIKENMDRHRRILDRFIRPFSSSSDKVVPSTDTSRTYSRTSIQSSSTPTYRPSTSYQTVKTESETMSPARRKLRDLLSRSGR